MQTSTYVIVGVLAAMNGFLQETAYADSQDDSREARGEIRWLVSAGVVDNGIAGIEGALGVLRQREAGAYGLAAYSVLRDYGFAESAGSGFAQEPLFRSAEAGLRIPVVQQLDSHTAVLASLRLGAARFRLGAGEPLVWRQTSGVDIGFGVLSLRGRLISSIGVSSRQVDMGKRSKADLPAGTVRGLSLGSFLRADWLF